MHLLNAYKTETELYWFSAIQLSKEKDSNFED